MNVSLAGVLYQDQEKVSPPFFRYSRRDVETSAGVGTLPFTILIREMEEAMCSDENEEGV